MLMNNIQSHYQLSSSPIIGQHNPNVDAKSVANSMSSKQGWHGLANIPKSANSDPCFGRTFYLLLAPNILSMTHIGLIPEGSGYSLPRPQSVVKHVGTPKGQYSHYCYSMMAHHKIFITIITFATSCIIALMKLIQLK